MGSELPSHAQVVIVGGGVVGCSIAYHLTKTRMAGRRASRTQAS